MSDDTVNDSVPDPIDALKADIEETRAELQGTVDELSDRLNPKKQLSDATGSITETARRTAAQAEAELKQGAEQAQAAAKRGVTQAQRAASGRERQIAAAMGVTLMVGFVLWRRRHRKDS